VSGRGGGRPVHRGLRLAGILLAVLAAGLVVLSEQGGEGGWRDWLGASEAPPPAETAAGTPGAEARERGPEPSPASFEERAAPEREPESDFDALFPAPGELREVRAALERIAAGGPFPYRKDGTEFRNRERRLPRQPAGYYREYTVETPGEDDRGARRLVRGRGGETFYTRDHYRSFARIDPEEVRRAP
jgi:ribonuclease T1